MHQVSRHSYSVGGLIERFVDNFNFCPWGVSSGGGGTDRDQGAERSSASIALYTSEQRRRRDESPWTAVQGVLAPLQFAVFALSLGLVVLGACGPGVIGHLMVVPDADEGRSRVGRLQVRVGLVLGVTQPIVLERHETDV